MQRPGFIVKAIAPLLVVMWTCGPAHADAGDSAILDHERVRALAPGDRVEFRDFALADGRSVDLRLERFEVLTSDAAIVVDGARGARPLVLPDVVLLRGTIAGDDEAHVFLGVSAMGAHGFVDAGGAMQWLSTGPYRPGLVPDLRVTAADRLPGLPAGLSFCGVTADRDDFFPLGRPEPIGAPGDGTPPCRAARVAVDTDFEFTENLFGGNTDASAAYAVTLLGAVSEIYRRDLNVRQLISFLRVWESNDDPYDAETSGDALNQLRAHWIANMGDVEREVAHLLSGDNLGGGVAWVSVVCSEQWGYAVSGNLGGSFPYPLQNNNGANWDPYVVAHEIGHNFGTLHTHDGYDPPLDGCGLGDCEGADQGTIMSYCHGCPGGMANIRLEFHPIVKQQILSYLEGIPCDIDADGVLTVDDLASTYEENPVTIDVLANDIAASCDGFEVEIDTFDALSVEGGVVTLVPAGEGAPHEQLRYTPPPGFDGLDTFGYTIVGGASAIVGANVGALRDPDPTGATASGVAVNYYIVEGAEQLPDFDTLVPYAEDVVADVNYTLTGGFFATSGRRTEIGAVFEGFVTVPEDGPYILSTESNDGSKLFVGDDRVVANDGLHGMREAAGEVLLHAGPHAVRVEFFNNTGGSGLIVRIEGPSLPRQPIDPSAWSYALPCPGDLDANGTVDFSDFLAVLTAWGPCPPECPEDLDGSGAVDFGDLLVLLSSWGPCL